MKECKLLLTAREGKIHIDIISKCSEVTRIDWNNVVEDLALDTYVRKPREEIYQFEHPQKEGKMEVKIIQGDGNCMLRSLLDQLGRRYGRYLLSDHNVYKLRKFMVDYIQQAREQFEGFMFDYKQPEEDFEIGISNMRKNKTQLGHEALLALTEILKIAIIVYGKDGAINTIGENYSSNGSLQIFYTGVDVQNHYDSIITENDEIDGCTRHTQRFHNENDNATN